MIRIKKGLDLPIAGSPEDKISNPKKPRSVGLIGADYHGLKASILVEQGEEVRLGQPILIDKKNPGVVFTSPAGGIVQSINRGARRTLQSIVIEIMEENKEEFCEIFPEVKLSTTRSSELKDLLISSGLWTSFKKRPFSKIPSIEDKPSSIFVNAMDSNPLSINPDLIISLEYESFLKGLRVLELFASCPIHVCFKTGSSIKISESEYIQIHHFSGPHPSGLTGTHMHFISPSSLANINW